MSKSKKKNKKKSGEQIAASVPSPTLLAAKLRSGAGVHKQRPTRSAERRQSIEEHS